MRNTALLSLLAASLVLPLAGCGVADVDDDYQAGNRLLITSLTDAAGHSVPVLNGSVKTDDSGKDGDPATVDADGSQGDKFPDEGETILEPLSDDMGKLSLLNEPRLGVDPGQPLVVYEVTVTYFDANGKTREFAPKKFYDVNVSVPTKGNADLTFVLAPYQMKADGLMWYLLYGTAEEKAAVSEWTAVVDVYSRDDLNDDDVHSQAKTSIRFIDPMVTTVGDSTTP